jgi:hypothetical protein
MAQQTATDDDAQLAHELDDLATVADATALEDSISVTFTCGYIPEAFNTQMLSDGYAVANAKETISGRMNVYYKSITDF